MHDVITVQRIQAGSEFGRIREEWDALLARSRHPSVFRSWAWQYAWWERFRGDKELRLLAARDSTGNLVGLAPLCLDWEGAVAPTRTLRFLGTERVSSEYLDIIVDADREETTAVALLEALSEPREWDVLQLTDLSEDATALRYWMPRLQAMGFGVERTVGQECPYLPLPPTREDLRRALGHSMRAAVSRAARKLAACGFTYRAETQPPALPAAMELLFELHSARWAARNRPGNFRDERVRGFHRDLVSTLGARGAMRLGMLTNGERVIAVIYTLEWAGVVSYYQSGFDPHPPHPNLPSTSYSPGIVLIGATVESAIARGFLEFDFLRGDEPYKRRWTAFRRRTWSMTAIRPSAWRAKGRHRMNRWIQSSRHRVGPLVLGRPRRARPAGSADAPRPIRVMHVLDSLLFGGMEYGVIKVVNRLPIAIEPLICCLRFQSDETKSVVSPRVRVLALGKRTAGNYGLILTLASVFRRERIDVVHSHNWSTYLYAVLGARLAGVPVVIHGEHGREDLARSRRRIWIKRGLASLVTRFLVVSQDLARELREEWHLGAERVLSIPNGVDLAGFDPSLDGAAVRRELGLRGDHHVVINVGGIRRVKDHSTLLRAFAVVHSARPSARLLIVGEDCDPKLREGLVRMATSLGVLDVIHFIGLRRDIAELLAASDVYVNSSTFEGMSNTILEAMAMRKPVVATRVGGNVELVRDGETGYLIAAGDAVAMAARIEELLAEPERRRAFGDAGRAHVEAHHRMGRMVDRYVDLYQGTYDRWWVRRSGTARD